MTYDINGIDPDMEIEEMFHGEAKPLHPDTIHVTLGGSGKPQKASKPCDTTHEAKAAQKPADKPKLAKGTVEISEWHPPMPEPNFMDRLKASAFEVAVFAGLNVLVFYWQLKGLMHSSIAIPSMCVCAALAGVSIGKNFFDRKR